MIFGSAASSNDLTGSHFHVVVVVVVVVVVLVSFVHKNCLSGWFL